MRIKSTLLLILASCFICILNISCNKENRWDCIKRTGKTSTELRVLPPFTRIYLKDNIDVYIKQGSTQEIKIEAGDNLVSLIKTEVDKGMLHIENDNLCNWARSYKRGTISVYITVPTLRYIGHFGSGLIKAADTLTCDTLEIWAHQSGDVEFTVNTNVLYTNMHTTADMTLHGKSILMGIWHAGEGYMHCEDLQTDFAWTYSKTSGNAYLNVSTQLSVTIDWEGNIYYTGNPLTTVQGNGIGKLIKQN